jgi:hypothetical protein
LPGVGTGLEPLRSTVTFSPLNHCRATTARGEGVSLRDRRSVCFADISVVPLKLMSQINPFTGLPE